MNHTSIKHRWLKLCGITFGILCAGGLLYLLARLGLPVPCLFRAVTGLTCPGCGNTRAVFAILALDLPAALQYNYLFPLEIAYIGWVYLHCAIRCLKTGSFSYRSPAPPVDWMILAGLLVWWSDAARESSMMNTAGPLQSAPGAICMTCPVVCCTAFL